MDFIKQPTTPALDAQTQAAIDRVVALAAPDVIYLFGSRARGEFDPDSDVDLLIVVPDPVGDTRQRQNELRGALARLPLSVDPWIMGRLEFEETKDIVGGLAYPATHDGRLVYAKP